MSLRTASFEVVASDAVHFHSPHPTSFRGGTVTDAKNAEEALAEKIGEARSNNAVAAAVAATLIHRHRDAAKKLGVGPQYQALLLQVLHSKDHPELLVCVAEELATGGKLAADPKLAQDFFNRADELSSYMGSCAAGRLFARSNPSLAIKLFGAGQRAGHVPSMIYRHDLLSRRVPLIGPIVKMYFLVVDFFVVWKAFSRGDIPRRFWRYRDVFRQPLEPVERCFSPDRAAPFSEIDFCHD